MSELASQYESMIEQEDAYFKQIKTAEMCVLAVYDHIFRYGEQFETPMAEEILLAIHQIEANLRLKLLHLRMEKAFLACEIGTGT